ncbi:MAG: CRISPR-associated endonuclease Cas3'', partial [Desulfobacterales bacterium]|nr:CRISPR-associated endonuclease Cas3'' [Desulfobacterales bacterium]
MKNKLMGLFLKYYAHSKENQPPENWQPLVEHLQGVAEICQKLTEKIDMPKSGLILGLLHDFGKYSSEFQQYLHSATVEINSNNHRSINLEPKKGK